MIELIEGMPDRVVAVEASGEVSADDYEKVLIPALDAALAGGAKASMLLVFGPDFDGYEAEAGLDDLKMGMHHWGDFEKIAFVSDHGGYRTMVRGLGFLMPGEVKVFELVDLESAKAWVGG